MSAAARQDRLPASLPRTSISNKANTTTQNYAIGIDLGTTYSCVAVYREGAVEIIPNEQGNRTTPSMVAFTSTTGRVVGEAAKLQASENASNTVFDCKRLIGRRFEDSTVQADSQTWPFKVVSSASMTEEKVEDSEAKPMICVKERGAEKYYSAEQISALVLSKMKAIAEEYLETPVTQAVITVPAYFNDAQRQATRDAGSIAGLEVLRIINEPTAAALAYGIVTGGSGLVLIFDLGGGTFDVSLLALVDGQYEVRATAGDTHLGGEDFDQLLMTHCLQQFYKENPTLGLSADNPLQDQRSLRRLRTACETTKKCLSAQHSARMEIDDFYQGTTLNQTVTRDQFEALCADMFTACMRPVAQVLADAKVRKDQIDQIVLVGGSTRIPKIQQMLVDEFAKRPCAEIDPDEAVAYGAAVQAAILTGAKDRDVLLVDVTPLSLGIETTGGVFETVIKRNTTVPCSKTKYFTTTVDDQEYLSIKVYEGERHFTAHCHYLGEFIHDVQQKGEAFHQRISVGFELNADGILCVQATEEGGNASKITINNSQNRLSKAEIEKAYRDAQRFQLSDKIEQQKIQAALHLQAYIHAVEIVIAEHKHELVEQPQLIGTLQSAKNALNATKQWLESLPGLQSVQDYVTQQTALEEQCSPLLKHCLTQDKQDQLLRDQHHAQIYEEQQKLKEAGGIRVFAGEEVIKLV